DIQCIMKEEKLSNSSKLLNLSPFLDEKNVLRVGGRLQHSELPLNHKHPMLIPNNCNICDLIIDHYHGFYLHTGVEATLANLRTQFWITNGRSTVKRVLHKCLKCLQQEIKNEKYFYPHSEPDGQPSQTPIVMLPIGENFVMLSIIEHFSL
ncbi:integrase_H2C2 domain-containing protein, partial [Nephila pilipes]